MPAPHLPVLPDTDLDTDLPKRPRTRGDCAGGPRPCPWYSCRDHLGREVHPSSGTIKVVIDPDDLDAVPETCSLDVADRAALGDEVTCDEIGQLLGGLQVGGLLGQDVGGGRGAARAGRRRLPGSCGRGAGAGLAGHDSQAGGTPSAGRAARRRPPGGAGAGLLAMTPKPAASRSAGCSGRTWAAVGVLLGQDGGDILQLGAVARALGCWR